MTTTTSTTTNKEGVNEMEEKEVKNEEQELEKHKAAAQKAKKKVGSKKKAKTSKKPKASKKKVAKKDIYVKPPHTKGIVTTKHLEEEFGIKAKVIRRYLRKMPESTKPRGAERYEWEAGSKELKAIRTNLEAIKAASLTNVR